MAQAGALSADVKDSALQNRVGFRCRGAAAGQIRELDARQASPLLTIKGSWRSSLVIRLKKSREFLFRTGQRELKCNAARLIRFGP